MNRDDVVKCNASHPRVVGENKCRICGREYGVFDKKVKK